MITARHFRHPVSIARMIMDKSPHCALSGEGALEFAQSLENFDEICAPEELKSGRYPNMEMSGNVTNEEYLEYAEYIHGRRPVQSMDEQQRRLDSYHVTFSTNEIALFWHCFCKAF